MYMWGHKACNGSDADSGRIFHADTGYWGNDRKIHDIQPDKKCCIDIMLYHVTE